MLGADEIVGNAAVYVVRTFKTFIEDLHEHGVPSRIDRSVLTRFSGVVGTQLMHALRFLGLIEDDGRPTERLKELVKAHGTANWSERFLELLGHEYAPMFAIDLETATPPISTRRSERRSRLRTRSSRSA